ncbi:hypothetical protein N2152v2_002262 [Parachlorella kessleri]
MNTAKGAVLGVDLAAGQDEGDWDKLEEELEGMTEEQIQARIQELEAASSIATATNEEQVHQLMVAAEPSVASGSVTGPARTASDGAPSVSAAPQLTAGNVGLHTSMMEKLRLEKSAEELRHKELATMIEKLEREKEALRAKNAQLEEALLTGKNLSAFDSHTSGSSSASARAAAKARRDAKRAELAKAGAPGDLVMRIREMESRTAAKQKGVDICIAMDLTGSMGGWIEEVKQKAMDILNIAPLKYPGAITRMAFVGYRDFGHEAGDAQHVVVDFVDKGQVGSLLSTIRYLRASGGGDAEDVTGMLKKVTELSWESSTRLLIHFGDAPCHGNKYHGGYARNGADRYPLGDPNGLVPEQLLEKLICTRVDYHFARICHHTDMMTGIFSKVYEGAPAGAAVFEIHDYASSADRFIDVVVKSLTSSMRRSYRGGYTSSSSSDGGIEVVLPPAFAGL